MGPGLEYDFCCEAQMLPFPMPGVAAPQSLTQVAR